MNVLLTGANGQVGETLRATVPAGISLRAVSHAELDIADRSQVRMLIDAAIPDLVINAAAYTAVDRAESEPEQVAGVNAEGPRHLAEALAARGHGRLLHISTDYVFDGRAQQPYRTEDTPNPLSVYGRTKLDGERAVLAVLGSRVTVLRTAWVYAPHGRNFLLTMLRLMRERGKVRIVADQRGTPTASRSIAQALWALVARPAVSGLLHWTDVGVASWYDFACAIAEDATALGFLSPGVQVIPISTAEYPTAAKRPAHSVLDTAGSSERLGLTPVLWRDRLRETLGQITQADV